MTESTTLERPASVARRRGRASRMNGARALGVLLMLYAASQAWLFVSGFPLRGNRMTPGATMAALGLWALATVLFRRPWMAAVGAALAAVQAWQFYGALTRMTLPYELAGLAAASWLLLAATALAALLLAARRASGAQALALALSVAAALWACNAAWAARRPEFVGRKLPPAFFIDGLTCLVPEVEEFGPRNIPNQVWNIVYSTNPRGYFHREPILDPIAVGRWQLHVSTGAEATLERTGPQHDVVRVEIVERTDDVPWKINLGVEELPLIAGERYRLRLRIRADEPRTARLVALALSPPVDELGLAETLELTPEWQELLFEFRALRDEPSARLMIELGAADPAVEIASAALTPLTGRLDMSKWRTTVGESGWATFKPYQAKTRRLGVNVWRASPGSPWSVMATQEDLRLAAGGRYRLEFWARADRKRGIGVLLHAHGDTHENLGLNQMVALDDEWRAFCLNFTAPIDAPDAVLDFTFANHRGLVELQDVALETDDAALRQVPLRYVVQCRSNALGYRDDDHPLEPPPGEFRIACLGDSFTVGMGVHEEDRFSNRLESLLNEQRGSDDPTYEVLNFGHSGYDTHQERLSYEHEAARFHPRVALVTMVNNDDMPWHVESQLPAFSKPTQIENLFAPVGARRKRQQSHRPRNFALCIEQLKLLKERCDEDGVRLAVVVFPNTVDETWEELREIVAQQVPPLGVPVLDLHPLLFPKYEPRQLWAHYGDLHPNEIAHAIAAGAMAKFLSDEGLLDPAASPTAPTATPTSEDETADASAAADAVAAPTADTPDNP